MATETGSKRSKSAEKERLVSLLVSMEICESTADVIVDKLTADLLAELNDGMERFRESVLNSQGQYNG